MVYKIWCIIWCKYWACAPRAFQIPLQFRVPQYNHEVLRNSSGEVYFHQYMYSCFTFVGSDLWFSTELVLCKLIYTFLNILKRKSVISIKFSSLTALEVVKMVTSGTASDIYFVKMTAFSFQRIYFDKVRRSKYLFAFCHQLARYGYAAIFLSFSGCSKPSGIDVQWKYKYIFLRNEWTRFELTHKWCYGSNT